MTHEPLPMPPGAPPRCPWQAACRIAGLALLAALGPASGALAQGADRGLEPFPPGSPYRPYLADPLTPTMGVTYLSFTAVGLADSGSPRTGLHLGGRFGLLGWGPAERRFQLEIEAGFLGWFDLDHSYDNIGWDGIYGLAATHRLAPRWALKGALRHISSHVGDEYAERTGRRRIGYTREEIQLGASFELHPRWRLYGEAAYAHVTRNEALQDPGRLQAGVEHRRDGILPAGSGWYAALDVTALEERGWEPDLALQGGWLVPRGDRQWRVALSYAAGRVPLGEFFQDEEDRWGLGLYLDL